MNAGMKSLTDLTKTAEMLESSLRFGMNLIAYSMGPQGLKLPPPPEGVAEFEKIYRYKGLPLPVLDDFTKLTDDWNKPTWVADSKDWFNELLRCWDFRPGTKKKKSTLARVSATPAKNSKPRLRVSAIRDLSLTRALVFDLLILFRRKA